MRFGLKFIPFLFPLAAVAKESHSYKFVSFDQHAIVTARELCPKSAPVKAGQSCVTIVLKGATVEDTYTHSSGVHLPVFSTTHSESYGPTQHQMNLSFMLFASQINSAYMQAFVDAFNTALTALKNNTKVPTGIFFDVIAKYEPNRFASGAAAKALREIDAAPEASVSISNLNISNNPFEYQGEEYYNAQAKFDVISEAVGPCENGNPYCTKTVTENGGASVGGYLDHK